MFVLVVDGSPRLLTNSSQKALDKAKDIVKKEKARGQSFLDRVSVFELQTEELNCEGICNTLRYEAFRNPAHQHQDWDRWVVRTFKKRPEIRPE